MRGCKFHNGCTHFGASTGGTLRKVLNGMAGALGALALFGLGTSPARAQFVITPTFDSSITGDPNAAAIEAVINQAIADYTDKFADPINVRITFGTMTGGLGQSTTGFYNVSYSTFLAALNADKTSTDDTTAVPTIPAGPNNPLTANASINVKSANLRAVGLAGAPFVNGTQDGVIGLNTHITDIGSPGTSGVYSLLSVTEHEIDEVLGLGSSLASLPFNDPFPEDLFRYSSTHVRNFTTAGDDAFFSIDGVTNLARFNNVANGGDYGDWHTGGTPQVQDAFATPGAHPALGVELTALDVIGYTFKPQSSVPEPGTYAFMGAFAVAGLAFVRRRNR
jgi:hypothetical protein